MDRHYLLHALERAQDWILTTTDIDTEREEQTAADLIKQLRDGIENMEHGESLVTVKFELTDEWSG